MTPLLLCLAGLLAFAIIGGAVLALAASALDRLFAWLEGW
jgi:hypothetical protein